jgi:hypothetical protein
VILLVSPAPPSSGHGNAVTATRWAEILRQLGHPVRVAQAYDGGEYQVLVALRRFSHSTPPTRSRLS